MTVAVDASGNTVVRYFYEREIYSFTLTAGEGVSSVSASGTGVVETTTDDTTAVNKTYNVQYDAEVSLSATNATGYTLAGYSGNVEIGRASGRERV